MPYAANDGVRIRYEAEGNGPPLVLHIGYIGGLDSPFNKLVFDNHRNTIIYGFVFLAIIYFIGWELLLPA